MNTRKFMWIRTVWFRYMVSYICLSLFPLTILMFWTNHYVQTVYRDDVLTRMMNSMERAGHDLDAMIEQIYSITVQISNIDAFKADTLMTDTVVFREIRSILLNYCHTNKNLQDIVYHHHVKPDLYYTSAGTYNAMYYKWYRDREGNILPAHELFAALNPVQLIPYVDVAKSRISYGTSLDIICALPAMKGAYLTFTIQQSTLARMLEQSEQPIKEVLLLDDAGCVLYASPQAKSEARPFILSAVQAMDTQRFARLSNDDYVIRADFSAKGLSLIYVTSAQTLFGHLVRMRNNLLMVFTLLSMGSAAAAFHRSQLQSKPIAALVQLAKGVFPAKSDIQPNSEFDHIREAILYIQSQNELLAHQSESQLRENKLLRALTEPMECPAESSNLIQKVQSFIEDHLDDDRLNASFVADRFSYSLSNLSHQFKTATNHALSDYIIARKLTLACEQLKNTSATVAEIAARLGYSQSSSFIRVFKNVYGITPNEYRKKCRLDQSDAT